MRGFDAFPAPGPVHGRPAEKKSLAVGNAQADQSLALLFNWRVGQHFALQPYYRFQWTHYTEDIAAVPFAKTHREDWLHSVGLTALFPINSYVVIRAFVGYDLMDTDGIFAQDFKKLDLGGGLNLSVRF